MISPTYNFQQFAEAVKERDYYEIITLAEQEATSAWRQTYSKHEIQDGSALRSKEYQYKLLGLIDFLRHSIKPQTVDDQDFQLFHKLSQYAQHRQDAYCR